MIGRLLVGWLMPPVCGGLLFSIYTTIKIAIDKNDASMLLGWPMMLLMMVYFSFWMSGIQSTVYTLLMELVVRRYCRRKVSVLAASTFLGLLSGLPFWGLDVLLVVVGALTGLIVGYFLCRLYSRSEEFVR